MKTLENLAVERGKARGLGDGRHYAYGYVCSLLAGIEATLSATTDDALAGRMIRESLAHNRKFLTLDTLSNG